MPPVYRSMKVDGDGTPVVAHDGGSGLGVRCEDVEIDGHGHVGVSKGMSVFPPGGYRMLPTTMIPATLSDKHGNPGRNRNRRVFAFGAGAFADGPLDDGLALFVDTPHHGHVVPSRTMELAEFRALVERTRDRWEIDEA